MGKTGILGGTFNPVHLGHLRAAHEVAETLGLDRVLFVPALIPPHKDPAQSASAEHRLEMVRLAVRDNPLFEVSDVELRRGGPSYTIDTLDELASAMPCEELYFIVGSELFRTIDSWHCWERLFHVSHFVVVHRPGYHFDPLKRCPLALQRRIGYDKKEGGVEYYTHESSKRVISVPIVGLNLSSTRIRELRSEGRSIRYLVPEAVERYIVDHSLYREVRP